ncbi:MAG: molybdopterin oxidoreductase, partial [Bdellovibrionota bacterium]
MSEVKAGDPGQYTVSSRMKTAYTVCMFLGLIGFALLMINDQKRAWLAFLLPFFYFTSLALGGLFFTAIQHLTKAGWSVNVRRITESFTSFFPVTAVAALIFLFGSNKIYSWMDKAHVAADAILQGKVGYLNMTFFVIRLVLFIGGWMWFSKKIVGRSIEQDTTGEDELSNKQVKTSIGFILFFALSYSFFAVDLLMSLEPHWFSTIYGVYSFAGLFQSTLAFTILLIIYMKKHGLLAGYVTDDHMHDLGKFLFAFTVFWAYIAFSQYMLIWYANLPEETGF